MNNQNIVAQSKQQPRAFIRKNAEILEMIATGQPTSDIYNAIALMYEARHRGLRCSLLELKGDKLKHGGAPSLPKAYCDAVNGLQVGPSVGSCGTSTYTGKRVLVENIETDPKWAEIKQAALPHGMRCCWSEPIKDSNGKVLGAFGMYYNHPALPNEDELADLQSAGRLAGIIMERDQREIALRQSEEKYRRLSENSPAIVFQFKMTSDGAFTFPYINDAVKSIMGIAAEDIMQNPFRLLDMVHPEDQEIFLEGIQKSAQSLEPYFAIIRYLKDEEERCIEARSTPDSMEDGSILWDGFFLDITERIKSEETIRNGEERFRGIVESMADWIWEIDSQGRYTYCSEKVESILGYTPEEMIGKTPFDFMATDEAGKIGDIVDKIIAEKGSIKNLVNWNISKDGREVCLIKSGVPILDKSENLLGFRGVDSDITDQKRAEGFSKTLFDISNAMNTTSNLDEIFQQIHFLLGKIIDVTNFFVAIVDEKEQTLFFPYHVDTIDDDFSPITNFDPRDSLTGLLVSNRKPVLLKKKKLQALANKNGVLGTVPLIWMGVPLIVKDEIIGVIVVQSYTDPYIYNEQNLEVLTSISDQIAIAIDRKRTEDELKKSEKRYRNLFENGSDLLCLHDLKGNLLETNLAHKKEYGWRHKDIVDKNIMDLMPEQYKVEFNQYLKRIVKEGKDEGCLKGYTKSGKKVIMEYHNKLIFDKNGQPEAVQGAARDITNKWETEKKLESSEKRYKILFEKAEDAIFILDASKEKIGQIVDANQCAAKMHGYSLEEIKKLNIKDLDAPVDASKLGERVLPILEGEWIKDEITHIRKDGSIFPVEISAGLIEIGNTNYILAIDRDIEERKEFENRLKKSEKMEAIGTLAGGIAHDFNNILSAIMGYTELMMSDFPETSENQKKLDNVLKASLRAKELVSQILTLSRNEKQELRPLKIQIIIQEALKLIRASIPSTITIKQDISKDCGMVQADPTQIHQVIMNLCTNSYQAMKESGGVLDVSLQQIQLNHEEVSGKANFKSGAYLKLKVSDTGSGIPQIIRDRIFDPYYTTKEKGEGTGLGLAVVHGIVTRLQGDITVDSDPGHQTVFQVFLPVISGPEKTVEENPVTEISMGSERILFIDDDEILVDVNKKFLEAFGYHVTALSNSLEAYNLFQNSPDSFDLIITDMTMPYITGDKLAEKVLKIRPGMPIILATGYSDAIGPERAKTKGIKGYLNKPYIQRHLAEEIRKCLGEKKEQVER